MRKRIPNPPTSERSGFGLVAWLEQTRIKLPLKGVECAFHVCGDVASVELDQIFEQNAGQPLDCLYTFPLPSSAAVYRCEMHVNDRVIRAKVEERERARELAREKKAAGHRTALVEMERDNLFTLSLGNLQPGEMVVIRFAYFQTLTHLGDWTSLNIPFCPGIRYVPGVPLLRASSGRGVVDDTDQVPDASRISPPRIDRLHPDAAYLSVEGTVEHPRNEVKDLSSPSHPVLVKFGAESSKVSIADQGAVPDCDFVVRWTETEAQEAKPMGWVTGSDGASYGLLRLRAPAQAPVSNRYSQDVYFLIDRSGSMQGLKWAKAVEAFREFLKLLGPDDRTWATFFESQVRDLAEKLLSASEVLSDKAVRNLAALGTGGGTELLPALEHILTKIARHSPERPVSLVVITDGQVGNEPAILRRLVSQARLRVHVFGIDVTLNEGFLQKLAAQNHGTSCLLSPQDDIVGAVARLGDRLRRPVLTSLRLKDGWDLAGSSLPDLHAGEILAVPLKSETSRHAVILEGRLPDGTLKEYRFDLVETSAAALPLLWAKRRIDFLLAKGESQAAIALGKENNLVCEGAAFIAWDETEKVPISESDSEVYQPACEPMSLAELTAGRAKAGLFCADEIAPLRSQAAPTGKTGLFHKLRDGLFVPGSGAASSLSAEEIAQSLRRWRLGMEKQALFQTSSGQRLLDYLTDWLRARPEAIESSLEKLEALSAALERARDRSATERLALIQIWSERNLDAPRKQKVADLLAQIESEFRVQAQLPAAR